MVAETILVTGANGHVGFQVVLTALQAGYKVRAAVRQSSGAEQIKASRSVQSYLHHFEVVVIPDMTASRAFDEAVAQVDYIIHVAFPMANGPVDYYPVLIDPGVKMTEELLQSAKKMPTVKRVVVTSSIAVLDAERGTVLRENDLAPIPSRGDHIPSPPTAYFTAKKLQMAATSDFVNSNSPGFDVINILPGVVLGSSELVTKRSQFKTSTNRFVIQAARGIDRGFAMVGCTAHVKDVAALHVRSLDASITGGKNFMLCQDNRWSEVQDIVRKQFPKAMEAGVFPCGGVHETKTTKYDDSETDRVFGDDWISFQDQVVDVLQSYLDATDDLNGK